MGYSNNRIFAESSQRPLSGGRDRCQGTNIADENAVYDRLEIS
jgi:hypothetical protein